MNSNARLSQLANLQQLQIEKRRMKHEILVQEKHVVKSLESVYQSFSVFSSIAGIVKYFTNSLSVVNGITMGMKLFSLFFRRGR